MAQLFENDDLKRYYSIKEVAEMFEVTQSLIRYWEQEFEQLKPGKNHKGDRQYTKEHLAHFQQVHHLVKGRGFTLEGAKAELKRQKEFDKQRRAMIEQLEGIKSGLLKLK